MCVCVCVHVCAHASTSFSIAVLGQGHFDLLFRECVCVKNTNKHKGPFANRELLCHLNSLMCFPVMAAERTDVKRQKRKENKFGSKNAMKERELEI